MTKVWDAFMATYLTPEEAKLAKAFTEARSKYLQDGLKPAVDALKAGNMEEAKRITKARRRPCMRRCARVWKI